MHVGVAELTGDSSPTEESILALAKHFRFGAFEFQTSPARLSTGGVPVKVRPQALQVLELLLSRAGEIVTREELREHLWGDSAYLDHERGINSALLHLRKALDDDPQSPKFIETVPRHGYRFIAPMELSETPLISVVDSDYGQPRAATPWKKIALVGVLLAAVVTLSALWGRFSATPSAADLPRLVVYPMQDASEISEPRPSATSLSDDLVRILVTDHADGVDLTAPEPDASSSGPPTGAPAPDADFLVMSSLTLDEQGNYGITLKLVRAEDRTIVWADTKHLPATDLGDWSALAAEDILRALVELDS